MTRPRQFQNAKLIADCICHSGCGPTCSSHHEGCTNDPNYVITKSIQAIERERHKRRVEKEIELQLVERAERRVEFDPSISVWAGLTPTRKPKGGVSHWGTW